MAGIGSHTRGYEGATDVWLTPPDIIKDLGPFDTDPCAAPEPRPWATATTHIVKAQDGLSAEWNGFCWVNPPYGPETGKWLKRLAEHKAGGIALVFARTETKMFQEHVWPKADALFFLFNRPHFYYSDGTRAEGNSGGPVMLVGYGDEAFRRLVSCKLPGKFISLFVKRG